MIRSDVAGNLKVPRTESERWLKRLVMAVGSAIPEAKLKKVKQTDQHTTYEYVGSDEPVTIHALGHVQDFKLKKFTIRVELNTDEGPLGYPHYDVTVRVNPVGAGTKSASGKLLAGWMMDRVREFIDEHWAIVVQDTESSDRVLTVAPKKFLES